MKHILTLVSVVVCGALGWCVYQFALGQAQTSTKPTPPRPMAVEVVTLQTCELHDRIELVGSLEPQSQVTIRSRTRGYISKLPYDIGDRLTEQTSQTSQSPIVIELEDSSIREALNGAAAALKLAQAQLQAKQAQKTLAEKTLQRQRGLARSRAISAQEVEQAQSQLAVASAEVELERARVAQAKSQVEQNRIALDELKIAAPFSGFVAQRFVDIGDLANPNDPLLHLVKISVVRTIVQVVEKDYERIQIGQSVDIYVDAFPERVFPGNVVRKSPVLDPETRTGAAHIEIANEQFALKPGMHARVSIVAQRRPEARVLPIASLLSQSTKHEVFVVVEGEPPLARRRQVQTGITDGNVIEILAGVGPHERVVTLGSRMLEDGQQINPLQDSINSESLASETAPSSVGPFGGG